MTEHTPLYFKSRPPERPHTASRASGDGEESSVPTLNGSLADEADAPDPAAEPQRKPLVQLGYVTFDGSTRSNASCGVLVSANQANHFRRDVYVGIHDREQNIEFMGRVVAGPFHSPKARRGDTEAPPANEETADTSSSYHVYGTIEILGRLTQGERLLPATTRPRPYSDVYIFPDHRLHEFLGLDGDFYLGHLSGHTNVQIHANSKNKNFLPRNVGIFGTVGSGKSNTAQVLTEEAIAAGWAVLLVDVEGEYVRMNQPVADPILIDILGDAHQRHPKRIDDFRVYVPSSGSSAADVPIPFKVPISALYPEVVTDILEFNEAETRVFAMVTEQATRLYSSGDPAEDTRVYDLQQLIDGLIETPSMSGAANVRLLPMANETDIATAGLLRSKLLHLGRSQMLDWRNTSHISELPVDDILVGGRLSVLDISETDDRSRNIAISYVLQELFRKVIGTPLGHPMPNGTPRPPVLVVIEEVHTFVSRKAAAKMRAVLDSLQTISRRGRKRWMSLALVSQQPNHVPDEVFELTNTRIIHQVKSPANLDPIKRTTPGVDETLWENVATIGPGQCLISGSVFKKPLLINIRPAQSLRLHAV